MPEAIDRASLAAHQTGVLLVEDDARLSMDITDRLRVFGLVVFEARDAEHAKGDPFAAAVRATRMAMIIILGGALASRVAPVGPTREACSRKFLKSPVEFIGTFRTFGS